jgi:serine protease Do
MPSLEESAMNPRLLCLVAVCGGLLATGTAGSSRPGLAAEIVELKSGHALHGDVLKEQSDALYVDIGIDVIRVPRDQIRERRQPDGAAGESQTPTIERESIYQTARLPVRSIKELAERFGEGVVLVQTPGGLGSGFLLNEHGHCVTNYHVIEQETRIAVTIFHRSETGEFSRRQVDDVRIVALNPFLDLALLQVPKQDDISFQPVFLAREPDYKEGDEVFAIGNPHGLERTVSQGIVSTRNRNFEGLVYIQTTAQINPGNSGGPLFNTRGEVVGVTNMKRVFSEGLGFAIPVFYLKHFLENRDAFAFDKANANTGYRYLDAPRRKVPVESSESE